MYRMWDKKPTTIGETIDQYPDGCWFEMSHWGERGYWFVHSMHSFLNANFQQYQSLTHDYDSGHYDGWVIDSLREFEFQQKLKEFIKNEQH